MESYHYVYRTDNSLHLSNNTVENGTDDVCLIEPLWIIESVSMDFQQLFEECRFTAISGTEQEKLLLFPIHHGICLELPVPFACFGIFTGTNAAHD